MHPDTIGSRADFYTPTLGGEGITKFNRLPGGCTESMSQTQTHTHTHPHTERKLLKVYSGKLKTKTRQHTHLTHMHASHTTWLINSNLNGRGLTSYTHAFWWCLEKTLQHLQRARERVKERERERQTEARLNVKVKNVRVSWRDQERLVEWQLGVAAQSSVTAAWQLADRCGWIDIWRF